MSIAIHGIGLGGGITIGQAYVIDKYLDDATQYKLGIEELDAEVVRFQDAWKHTRRELESLRGHIPAEAPAELGAFLALSIMMLGDSQIAQAPIDIILAEKCNVEWALKLQANKLISQFDEMEDEYLKERKHDIMQVLERIFKNLEGNKFDWTKGGKTKSGVLIAHDLSPADLIHFKDSNYAGFITEVGSLTSHTAIVGRNLEIPAIVGANYARQLIRENEMIIVDGIQGVLIINPDEVVLEEYKIKQRKWVHAQKELHAIRHKRTVTLDGTDITLLANIDGNSDMDDVIYNNAAGIGLYRSEFLFLAKENHLCSEDEQFFTYMKIARSMKQLPVIIRTADLGADKTPVWNVNEALNPALGLTGVRLSLVELEFFRIQLRAILRASNYGNIQIMFPMISSSWELSQVLQQLEYAKLELINESIPFNSEIKVGVMIEIPAAALAIKDILTQVDFVSIGTNDLLQYLLAIDRNNQSVNYLYNPLHPAVLKIMTHIIKACDKSNVPLSVCGEMAGDSNLTRLLLGMGVRTFSMLPSNILSVKRTILNTDLQQIKTTIAKIFKTESLELITQLVEELNVVL